MTRFAVVGCVVGAVCATGVGTEITIGPRTYEVTEARVNETTSDTQNWQSAAVLTDGKYIIGWGSEHQLSYGTDCFGKVYTIEGDPNTSEILLNPYKTSGWQYGPVFAPLPDGGFAVPWADSSTWVYLQRFDSDMSPIGTHSLVFNNINTWPVASSAPNGDFVVACGEYEPNYTIWARRYDSSCTPYGSAWQVNTDPPGLSGHTSVHPGLAMAPDGSFTLAWYNGSGDIRAQRYDPNGVADGGEFTVNSSTGGLRYRATVRYTSTGESIFAWYGAGDGDTDGIYARRFAADGSPMGAEWLVNETTSGWQGNANLGIGANDEFAICYRSADGDGTGIFARLYDGDGDPVGSEFQVNQYTSGDQYLPYKSGHAGVVISGTTLFFSWYGSVPGDSEGIGLTVLKRKGTALTVTIKKHPEWGEVLVEPNLPYYDPNGPNNVVTLTAIATEPSRAWMGWEGDVDPNDRYTNPLTITMDADKDISTSFKCGMGTGPLLPMALGVLGLFVVARRRRTRS